MEQSRAFSLIEMIVTLVVAVIMVALGIGAYQTVLGGADRVAAGVSLSTARLDVQRVAYANGSSFPEGTGAYKTQGLTYQEDASGGLDEVSVHRVDDTTLVLAQSVDEGQCLVLVSSLERRATWGVDASASSCSAALAASHLSSMTSLDEEHPSLVDLS
jgi:prepilin-type N-terminal cleavage/methylation domain-containing protein